MNNEDTIILLNLNCFCDNVIAKESIYDKYICFIEYLVVRLVINQ